MGDTLKSFLIALVGIFLFAFAILSYGTWFSNDNEAQVSINNDSSITNIQSNINNDYVLFNSEADINSNVSTESTIAQGSQATNTGSQFRFKAFRNTLSSIFASAKTNLFGGSSTFAIIFGVIFALIIVLGILYTYKAWIGGQPA